MAALWRFLPCHSCCGEASTTNCGDQYYHLDFCEWDDRPATVTVDLGAFGIQNYVCLACDRIGGEYILSYEGVPLSPLDCFFRYHSPNGFCPGQFNETTSLYISAGIMCPNLATPTLWVWSVGVEIYAPFGLRPPWFPNPPFVLGWGATYNSTPSDSNDCLWEFDETDRLELTLQSMIDPPINHAWCCRGTPIATIHLQL
jgi:hypothetical protein